MRNDGQGRNPAQWFCLLGGGLLIVRGALGVVLDPSFETPGEGWHQLIHFTSGVVLVALSGEAARATAAALTFGTLYAAIAVTGIVNGEDVIGLIGVQASDNTIHTVLSLASLGAGLLSLRRPQVAAG